MISVLALSDGTVETVLDDKDFSDLLNRKLGSDVKDWFDLFVVELYSLANDSES
jgi:hypothetical protein